ncbi:hypothetical protein [Saccharolobus sp. A20]|uniref:hypothetical protein n=1 Tax=Saccharolobus sp. A20 TaxID=1891280 RepID=UPI0008460CDF|nr:hypothetical protein [Sulfolobus sp. A20]
MNKGIIILSLVLTTLAPGILASLHFSPFITVFSLVLGLVIAFLTYSLINVNWDYEGLYNYVKTLKKNVLSILFLISWIISYYLYVIYTSIYVSYYVLNLDGLSATLVTLLVSLVAIGLSLSKYSYYAFPAIAFSQMALVLPIGWKFSVSTVPVQLSSLFLNILSSSLVVVCITLSTFVRFERKFSFYVLLGYGISSIFLLYGSFLVQNSVAVYGTALGNIGLIFAEFFMLNNLLSHGFNVSRRTIYILGLVAVIASLIGNVNYTLFYNSLIYPSVTLLYVSLFVAFLSIFSLYRRSILHIVLGVIALTLFAYGDYSVISSARGIFFLESVTSLILIILLSILLSRERRLARILKG